MPRRPNKPVRPTHQPNPVVNNVLPGEEGNASVPVFVNLILEFTTVAVIASMLPMWNAKPRHPTSMYIKPTADKIKWKSTPFDRFFYPSRLALLMSRDAARIRAGVSRDYNNYWQAGGYESNRYGLDGNPPT